MKLPQYRDLFRLNLVELLTLAVKLAKRVLNAKMLRFTGVFSCFALYAA